MAHDRRVDADRIRGARVSPARLARTARGVRVPRRLHGAPSLAGRDGSLRPLVPHVPVTTMAEAIAPGLELFCVGLNHETSPLDVRDALVMNDEEVGRA